ncbi:MAG: acyl carrier protein [Bacteroidetes bacterium CG23_combo_of_CG06-09_8_20_14_all_32_9]|nr:MAG: acyl carrier protein [Bacteroidetes bacterium CG23_combo_of_CG06-09_8_20_14_all_32_9]
MVELIEKLKIDIIEALNLEDVKPADIDADAPLFMDGLSLDSIDALELIVLLEKKYGSKIQTAEEGKKILYSIRTMADFISNHQKNK